MSGSFYLGVTSSRFVEVVALVSTPFISVAESHLVVWVYSIVFVHPSFVGHLSCAIFSAPGLVETRVYVAPFRQSPCLPWSGLKLCPGDISGLGLGGGGGRPAMDRGDGAWVAGPHLSVWPLVAACG